MNTTVFPEAVYQVNLITNTCFCPTGSNLHMLLLKEACALISTSSKFGNCSSRNKLQIIYKKKNEHLTDNN